MPRFTLPLLIVLFGFAVPLKAGDGVPTTVIVWPVADSDADENAQWMSGVLLGEFSKDSGLYLVDPQKVAGVLQYHVAMVGRAGTDNKEAAQSYLVLGKQHYFDLDYAASKAELLRAIELLQAESDHLFSEGALLLEAYLTLGLVQQAQNNDAEALDSFRQVLAIDPKYQLDAQSFAPSLVRLFSEAQKEKKGNGVIAVETDPKVAEVYCNGIYRGVSPVKISGLPSGEYALMIRTDHYREVRRWVTVSDEAPVAIKTKLEWQGAVQKSGPVAASQDGASRDGAVQTGAAQIAEGVRIADLLHVDKVVLVDVDESAESGQLTARMIDRQFRAGHNPVVIRYGADRSGMGSLVAPMAETLRKQMRLNIAKNPQRYVDPDGVGNPVLLGRQASVRKKKVWVWSGLGTAAVGGLVGGIVAATAGGKAPPTGSIAVSFK